LMRPLADANIIYRILIHLKSLTGRGGHNQLHASSFVRETKFMTGFVGNKCRRLNLP
jgi:hypothetical protein